MALYQFTRADSLFIVLVRVIVTLVSYYGAKVVPGIGIPRSPLLAPLTLLLT
ncbi:DUF1614 domain-containing protein [Coleofasciculus sp. H7-2]|uniref:DUF1614 domain-containing protein n=1 Tax=Coleofasciculus sp. H7-2 TaxID=3351545 RepID=UPI00366FBEFF